MRSPSHCHINSVVKYYDVYVVDSDTPCKMMIELTCCLTFVNCCVTEQHDWTCHNVALRFSTSCWLHVCDW